MFEYIIGKYKFPLSIWPIYYLFNYIQNIDMYKPKLLKL